MLWRTSTTGGSNMVKFFVYPHLTNPLLGPRILSSLPTARRRRSSCHSAMATCCNRKVCERKEPSNARYSTPRQRHVGRRPAERHRHGLERERRTAKRQGIVHVAIRRRCHRQQP